MPLSIDLSNGVDGMPLQCVWGHLASDDTLQSYILQRFGCLAKSVGVLSIFVDVEICGFFENGRKQFVREFVDA